MATLINSGEKKKHRTYIAAYILCVIYWRNNWVDGIFCKSLIIDIIVWCFFYVWLKNWTTLDAIFSFKYIVLLCLHIHVNLLAGAFFSRFWGSLPSTFKIFRLWKKSSTIKSSIMPFRANCQFFFDTDCYLAKGETGSYFMCCHRCC